MRPDAAKSRHYELPPEFFALILGPHCKYSSCFYKMPETTLAEAEATALEAAALHAGLANGTDASLWQRLWRLFFLAAAGLFGARQGAEWGVSHYRLKPV